MKKIIFLMSAMLLTSSCVETAVLGSVATVGTVAVQERTAGKALDDTAIFWKIKQLYVNEEKSKDLLAGISVEVIEGRVHLTGTVNSTETRIDAVRLAWKPKGVVEVINDITIKDENSLTDIVQNKWIKTQISSRLLLEKGVRSVNYSIEVVDGVVYLMGIAQDANELNKVTTIASMVKGVQKVVNHAILKTDASRS
ncbi:MAG: BON domain-containing protein [Rickettsiales bacterium]|nr:BON domain-containing protein [Pseudomonadota bacterium]MDA0965828.1 BON domain-containing protein [Pseudomonadota bacterium]MDG4542702.1 BON domain-containing protein [Rickettsiales bacterium]MDG4545206.1 BON domain-containing protein [Rickettsiales bacterium]MDG4547329.1 BON domain-containing protein [Rickettsiales bacterium]